MKVLALFLVSLICLGCVCPGAEEISFSPDSLIIGSASEERSIEKLYFLTEDEMDTLFLAKFRGQGNAPYSINLQALGSEYEFKGDLDTALSSWPKRLMVFAGSQDRRWGKGELRPFFLFAEDRDHWKKLESIPSMAVPCP